MRSVLLSVLVFQAISTSGKADSFEQFKDCQECPTMIELPLGEFVMGQRVEDLARKVRITSDLSVEKTAPDDPYVKEDEGPLHKVQVDVRIAMGVNEITFREWQHCVDDGGCQGYEPSREVGLSGLDGGFTTLGPEHPVTHIGYSDMQNYITWLNTKTDTSAYRLPTEAEWEYAARAGTSTVYAQGNTLTSDQANFNGRKTEIATQEERPDLRTPGAPLPVHDLDAANAWGLRHMSGNVSEMTSSCYTERYLEWSTTSEWLENTYSGQPGCLPVVRSGNYALPLDSVRVAWRARVRKPDFRSNLNGFRVVKEISHE